MSHIALTDAAKSPPPVGHWSRTVPRELVHKQSVSEVLVTGWAEGDDECTRVWGQWPPGNAFYRHGSGGHFHLGVVVETFRQAVLLTAHRVLDVPLGCPFVMLGVTAHAGPDALRLDTLPGEVEIRVSVAQDRQTRAGRIVSWRLELIRDMQPVGHGTGELLVCDVPTYRLMRGEPTCPPTPDVPPGLAADEVGCVHDGDVVVSRTSGTTYRIHVPIDHPNFFDHPVDHVPGQLVLEAAAQAARHLGGSGSLAVGTEAVFTRFGEYGEPLELRLRERTVPGPDHPDLVAWDVLQQGAAIATVSVELCRI